MPSPLEAAGAAVQPINAAPLHTNEFFTGMWSNGSPLGPGAVPYLYAKFYSGQRYDRLIDGNDVEISPRLTLIRRPGHSVYNPGPFPPINRFFEFRGFTATDEIIRIMADCDAPVNPLLNPNFDSGTTGWNLAAQWSVGSGVRPDGSTGNIATWTGPGSGGIVNQAVIPCTPGTVYSAQCWAKGATGATGNAALRLDFFNGSTLLLTVYTGVAATGAWIPVTVTGTAPASTTLVVVDFIVQTSTDASHWYVSGFAGGLGSTSGTVREVTQPSTNNILWTKAAGAGRTSFVSDGNILYAGDGVNTHEWVTSAKSWQPNTVYQRGDFIIDSNNNLQMAVGAQTGNLTNIMVENYGAQFKVTIFLSASTPLSIANNVYLHFAGLTTEPALNGLSIAVQEQSQTQFYWITAGGISVTPFAPETGTVDTSNGQSGSAQPTWQTSLNAVTPDGNLQWINKGPSVMPWSGNGPIAAPVISMAPAPVSIYPVHAVNTWYAPNGVFIIQDPANNLQQLVQGGVTGGSAPAWASTLNAITNDGTCKWKMIGQNSWQASHAYSVGQSVIVTYTYYITVPVRKNIDGTWVTYQQQQAAQATSLFQCTVAGTSGTAQPTWNNGTNTTTADAGVQWLNTGPAPVGGPAWPGGAQTLSIAAKVISETGYLETATVQAETAATAPTSWTTDPGSSTTDGNQTWVNSGPFAIAADAAWQWAYSGKNSITGEISTASPISAPLLTTVMNLPVIQGQGLANPPWDTIVLWRTKAGGSTLLYEDEFPNPGPGQTWIYTDSMPDSSLNTQFPAPIAGTNSNDPPPNDFVPQCYYLGRIWGYVRNQLRWTGGPDTITGAGNSTMPSKNRFTFPAKGVVVWPTSIGLICITTSDIWAVLGQGTPDAPFYAVMFQAGIGMLSQDAFGVNGSTAYAMLTSHQVVSMDPGAGEVEVGFPIADIFDAFYDPAKAYLTWHQGYSKDTALYVANGSGFWYRMAAVAAPESGNVWSPAAVIRAPGHVRAMASIEVTPGVKKLILGPDVDGNPILLRDPSTNADNGIAYPAHALVAPVVLAQPGTTAGFQFVVTEEYLITGSTPLYVRVLFDEITTSPQIHASDFRVLRNITTDPPNLPRSKSVLTQRHWGTQDPSTVIKCRYYTQDIVWATENFPNELFTNTVYGRLPEKARK